MKRQYSPWQSTRRRIHFRCREILAARNVFSEGAAVIRMILRRTQSMLGAVPCEERQEVVD